MAMLPNAAQHIYNLAMTQLPTMVTMTAQTDNPPTGQINRHTSAAAQTHTDSDSLSNSML